MDYHAFSQAEFEDKSYSVICLCARQEHQQQQQMLATNFDIKQMKATKNASNKELIYRKMLAARSG